MNNLLKFASAAAALAGMVGSAQALEVTPGSGPIAGPPPTSALGTLLDSIATTITTPTFTGVARSAVYDGPEAGANLNFYYQFSSTDASTDAISRMTAGGFGTWGTDVFQSTAATGAFEAGNTAAATVDRSTTGVLGFNFQPDGLMPGESSNVMEVRTTATAFASSWMGVINSTAGFAPAFAPAIPEPETYALMLAGLGLLGFVGRRRLRDQPPGQAGPQQA